MIYKLIALLALTGLAGCNPLRGTLQVFQTTTVNVIEKYNGRPTNTNSRINLQGGNYSASLSGNGNRAVLNFMKDGNLSYDIVLPLNGRVPQNGGQFSIRAWEINQFYDLVGNVQNDTQYSRNYNEVESCTKQVYERVCRRRGFTDLNASNDGIFVLASASNPIDELRDRRDRDRRNPTPRLPGDRTPNRPSPDRPRPDRPRPDRPRPDRPRPVPPRPNPCHYEYRTYYGQQTISYRYRTDIKRIHASFVKDRVTLASFRGEQNSQYKEVISRGICRINRR